MIPLESAQYPVFAATDPGKVGKNNEDNFAVSAYRISETDPTPSIVAIIADGVGGHQAGEVASSLAVELISHKIAESDASQPLATMEDAFFQANQAIYSQATITPANAGMSTTAACVWVIGDRLYLTSVGDSRVYLKRGNRLIQLTIDHTWVQEAMESGILTPEQADSHPNAHLIRRYLGSKQPPISDFRIRLDPGESDKQAVGNQGMTLKPGDLLLLCTDGLTDLVSKDEINSSLGDLPLPEILQGLIDEANSRGGHDNITVIGIQIPEEELVVSAPQSRTRYWLLLALVALLAVVLYGGWYFQSIIWGEESPTATIQQETTSILSTSVSTTTTLPPTATQTVTEAAVASLEPSLSPPPETGIPATYTPWPTSTTAP
ncbi:MAG: PP2C family protein-serine/threonine phosphatase [Anaerolineales bacterium]